MAGLVLNLRPHEQLMINGVIVENGDRKGKLRVCTEGAHILRLRDAMRPKDATTPRKRAYYAAQMAVAGELTGAQAILLIDQALKEYGGPGADTVRHDVTALAREGDFYKAMRTLGHIAQECREDAVFEQKQATR